MSKRPGFLEHKAAVTLRFANVTVNQLAGLEGQYPQQITVCGQIVRFYRDSAIEATKRSTGLPLMLKNDAEIAIGLKKQRF